MHPLYRSCTTTYFHICIQGACAGTCLAGALTCCVCAPLLAGIEGADGAGSGGFDGDFAMDYWLWSSPGPIGDFSGFGGGGYAAPAPMRSTGGLVRAGFMGSIRNFGVLFRECCRAVYGRRGGKIRQDSGRGYSVIRRCNKSTCTPPKTKLV